MRTLMASGVALLILVSCSALVGGWLCRRHLLAPLSPEARLQAAIHAGDIVPYYQPVVDARTGQVCGAEVLARWVSGGREVAGPDTFIPLAEANGLMVPLTRGLLARVLSDIRPLLLHLPTDFHLGVNLSVAGDDWRELEWDLRHLQETLGRRRVQVVVEVTESAPVAPDSRVSGMLQRLRLAGLKVALDDFGTGYASLAHLSRLPLDFLKLDRMFTQEVQEAGGRKVLADNIILLAAQLGLGVIAEGVETAYQADYLRERGGSLQQGWYWSRALPAGEFARYLIGIPCCNLPPPPANYLPTT